MDDGKSNSFETDAWRKRGGGRYNTTGRDRDGVHNEVGNPATSSERMNTLASSSLCSSCPVRLVAISADVFIVESSSVAISFS